MKNVFEKNKKYAIYIAMFLVVLIIVFAIILFNQNDYIRPDASINPTKRQPAKEKTIEDAIKDLSAPVPIPEGSEIITEETIKSLSNPAPIKEENAISSEEIKNVIEGLSKPVEIK
jgi:cytoskeletal protein RodZ